jgi:hypothetical protein
VALGAWFAAVLLVGPDETAVAAAPPAARAPESHASLAGSGLLTQPDATTLPAGRVRVAALFDNRDRDPIQLDQLDFALGWGWGLGARTEAYGHLVVSRAISTGQRTTLFPPPLDLVIPVGAVPPPRPYSPLYAPFPYVNRLGGGRLEYLVPGDAVLGGKRRLLEARGARPALAASVELKLPLTQDIANLQSGAGTGGVDVLGRATADWRVERWQLVANASFQRVGAPAQGDRLITYAPGGEVVASDAPLDLPDRLELGLGARHRLSPRLALLAEIVKTVEVGSRTPVMSAPGPLDALAGAQLRRGRAQLTLAVRYHANSIAPRTLVPWSLGGFADLSRVSPSDLAAYLDAIGAGGVLPHLRRRSQRALAYPPGGPPLPPETLLLPRAYELRSHGRVASLVLLSWTFGGAHPEP